VIDSQRVTEIFLNCLFREEEIINGEPEVEPIKAYGVMENVGFYPTRIKESTEEIKGFINELPEQFKNGWTFLNICQTKDGELWTGMHQVCDQLVMLGIAIGKMSFCLPRDMWSILPGGMPYVQVSD